MNYILSKTQYETLALTIKDKTASKTLTSADIILYNAVRGKPLDNGFSPLTNPGRLNAVAGGEFDAFKQAKSALQSKLKYKPSDVIEMFAGNLTAAELASIAEASK